MTEWVTFLLILGVWLLLQTWLLPRMGVRTCVVPCPRRGMANEGREPGGPNGEGTQ